MSCITQRANTKWPPMSGTLVATRLPQAQPGSICQMWCAGGRYSNLPTGVPLSFIRWLRRPTFTLCWKCSTSFSRCVVHAHGRFLPRRIFARAFSTPPEVKRNKKMVWTSYTSTGCPWPLLFTYSASCNIKRIKLNNKYCTKYEHATTLSLPDNCSLHWHCHKDDENDNNYNWYSNGRRKVRGCGCFCVNLVNVPCKRMRERPIWNKHCNLVHDRIDYLWLLHHLS